MVDSDNDKKKVEVKTERDDMNVLNAEIATLNLCHQNSAHLETTQARVKTFDDKRSKQLRIFFDNGSQVSFITLKAKKVIEFRRQRK